MGELVDFVKSFTKPAETPVNLVGDGAPTAGTVTDSLKSFVTQFASRQYTPSEAPVAPQPTPEGPPPAATAEIETQPLTAPVTGPQPAAAVETVPTAPKALPEGAKPLPFAPAPLPKEPEVLPGGFGGEVRQPAPEAVPPGGGGGGGYVEEPRGAAARFFAPQAPTPPGTAERLGRQVVAGALGTAEGMGGALQWITGGAMGKDFSDYMADLRKQVTPEGEASFAEQLASGAGSMATFFIPGFGVARGLGIAARVAPKAAAWLGAGIMAVTEAATEAGQVYRDELGKGVNPGKASGAANWTFWLNLPVLTLTDKLAFFGNQGKALSRALRGMVMEGSQESLQEVISTWSKDEQQNLKNILTSGAVGALLGGGVGAIAKPPGVVEKPVTEPIAALEPTVAPEITEPQVAIPEEAAPIAKIPQPEAPTAEAQREAIFGGALGETIEAQPNRADAVRALVPQIGDQVRAERFYDLYQQDDAVTALKEFPEMSAWATEQQKAAQKPPEPIAQPMLTSGTAPEPAIAGPAPALEPPRPASAPDMVSRGQPAVNPAGLSNEVPESLPKEGPRAEPRFAPQAAAEPPSGAPAQVTGGGNVALSPTPAEAPKKRGAMVAPKPGLPEQPMGAGVRRGAIAAEATPAEERAAFRTRYGTARGVGTPEGLVSKHGTLDRALETGNLAAIVRHYGGFRSDSELIRNFEPEEQKGIYLFSRKPREGISAQGPDELAAELRANHPKEFGHIENGEQLLRMIANKDIYKKANLDKMVADVEEGYAALEKDAATEGYSPEDVARATAEDQELQRAERDAILSEGGPGGYDLETGWPGVEEPPALRAGAPKPTALESRLDTLEADYPGVDREKAATVIRALPNAEPGQVVNMAADPEMFAQVARGNLAASEKAQLLKKATDVGAQQGLPGMGGPAGLFDIPPPTNGKRYSIQESRQYGPVFYSQMQAHLEAKLPGKGSGPDLANLVEGWGAKGQFKADELKWSGLVPWLREQKGPVTKQQVADFLKENQVEVREVQKWKPSDVEIKEDNYIDRTKFASYLRLPPGGQNYREVLLTVPDAGANKALEAFDARRAEFESLHKDAADTLQTVGVSRDEAYKILRGIADEDTQATWLRVAKNHLPKYDWQPYIDSFRESEAISRKELDLRNKEYNVFSAHAYGDTAADVNRFAHIFMDDRVIDGKKYLTIWEMQSDWRGQRIRGAEREAEVNGFKKGTPEFKKEVSRLYSTQEPTGGILGVPPFPFQSNWHEVALKKALRMAAEEGYDGVAWATGDMVKGRYDLAKILDKNGVQWSKRGDNFLMYATFQDGTKAVDGGIMDLNKIEATFGKGIRKQIEESAATKGQIVGENLSIGGEWANRQYDQMMPQFLNKYGKQWGARVGEGPLATKNTFEAEFEGERVLVTRSEAHGKWMVVDPITGKEIARGDTPEIIAENMGISLTGRESIHTLPITSEMKESVLTKGQPLYRAEGEATPRLGEGEPVTLETVKREMGKAGYLVKEAVVGESTGYHITLPSGKMIFVITGKEFTKPSLEEIKLTYPNMTQERLDKGVVAGEWRPISLGGIASLAKEAGVRTFRHEVGLHGAADLVLTTREMKALLQDYGDWEGAARAYEDWSPHKGPENPIFRKIWEFFRDLMHLIRPTSETTFEQIASGEVWLRKEVGPGARSVEGKGPLPFAPAQAPEVRYLIRNTRFAQDPTVRRVEDMFERSETAFKELRTPKLKEHWENLKRLTIDTSANIKKELLARGGDAGRRVEMMHDLMRGASAKGESIFREAEDKVYTGLSKVEEIVLNRIIQARRVMAIEAYKPDLMHPEMIGAAEYQAYLDSIPRDVAAKLMPRVDEYFAVWQDNLTAARHAGLINDEAYQAMVNHEYSPRQFIQHIDPEGTGFDARGRKITVTESGIKKLKEGSDQLLNLDSRLMLAQGITRTQARIFKNNANLALYDLAQKTPDNGFVRVDPGKPGPQETQVKVMIDGQPIQMVMPDKFAREWVHSDPMISAQMATVLGYATGSKLLRATATGMNPGFAITNIFRDMAHIWLTTHEYSSLAPKFTLQMGKDILEVMGDAIHRKGAYKQYINEGGGMSFLTNQGQEQRLTGTLGKIQHYLGWIGETSEILTRLALRNRALKNLGNKSGANLEATWTARNYLDFSQGGSFSKAVDSAVPYLNASIQGTRGIFRAARTDPKLFTWKVAQIGALATGLYLANQLINPDGWDEVPENEKVTNWIITTPFSYIDEMGNKRYHYIRIAKDQGQRIFASAFEGALGLLMGKKIDGDQIASAISDFLPVVPNEKLPPALQAMLGYYSNKDFWRNKDIWQGPKVEASEEYTKYTNPVLVKAGELTGTSPERLGYALGSMVPATNTFVALVGGGIKSLVSDLPEKDRQSVLETISKPITSKFLRTTDPYTPYAKDIEELSVAESTMKLKQRRGLEKLIDANIDQPAEERMQLYRDYISQQDPNDTKRLIKEVKNYEAYHELADRRWWLKLSHLDPEVRAEAFYKRYKNVDSVEQERLSELAKKLPGINSDRFKGKLLQLDSGLEMPEVDESVVDKGLAEAMGFAPPKSSFRLPGLYPREKKKPYSVLGI